MHCAKFWIWLDLAFQVWNLTWSILVTIWPSKSSSSRLGFLLQSFLPWLTNEVSLRDFLKIIGFNTCYRPEPENLQTSCSVVWYLLCFLLGVQSGKDWSCAHDLELKSGAQEWYIAILGLQVFEMIFFHFQFLTPPNILQPCTKLCNKRKLYTCVFSAVCGAVPAWFFTHDAILKLGVSNFETICFFLMLAHAFYKRHNVEFHGIMPSSRLGFPSLETVCS